MPKLSESKPGWSYAKLISPCFNAMWSPTHIVCGRAPDPIYRAYVPTTLFSIQSAHSWNCCGFQSASGWWSCPRICVSQTCAVSPAYILLLRQLHWLCTLAEMRWLLKTQNELQTAVFCLSLSLWSRSSGVAAGGVLYTTTSHFCCVAYC